MPVYLLSRGCVNAHLQQGGEKSARYVVEEKSRRAHGTFDYSAKHHEHEHVEEQMHKSGMDKHIGE